MNGATGADGATGPTGATGNTGPTGPEQISCECGCSAQMRNILQQIIQLYPTDNIIVSMESGDNVSGRASALLPAPDSTSGLLQLSNEQGVPQEAVSICRIAAFRITSTVYNNAITYIPTPSPTPTACDCNCEAAIRSYLPINTTGANIKAGGQTVATGTVLKNEFGMVVIVGPNNSDPSFVSTCKAEVLNKNALG